MLYQISNGAVAFGDDLILHSIDFEIRNTEKIAIVGRNGCGNCHFRAGGQKMLCQNGAEKKRAGAGGKGA